MIQSKEIRVGLSLVAALIGMSVSATASALPEMEVGSRLVQNGSSASAQMESVDPADTEESDPVDASDVAESTSN
jgi:hypothetical protein